MPTIHVVNDDALYVLRALDSDSIDSIITDPPYALSSRFSVAHSRFPGHRGKRRGFLGNAWDAALPDPEVWSEALRVLKPGGFLLAFGGARTYHRLATAIENVGFVIRDMLEWVHTQGMPKWFDVEREVAKLDQDAAPNWRGWQLNLKPAHEPIVLAQKPLSEETFAANVLRWGVGALNVDACRIPFQCQEDEEEYVGNFASKRKGPIGYSGRGAADPGRPSNKGRYPADVVTTAADVLGPGSHVFSVGEDPCNVVRARKASRVERNVGDIDNHHPTVKPFLLMVWLVRLVTPKGGTVLDPFAGSGTTGLAALAEGCGAILVEQNAAYAAVANARLAGWGAPMDLSSTPPPQGATAS